MLFNKYLSIISVKLLQIFRAVITGVMLQYVLPLFSVIIAYIMVANSFRVSTKKLEDLSLSRRMMGKIRRRRRTDILLTVISLLFFLSWAPLNVLNLVINADNPFQAN